MHIMHFSNTKGVIVTYLVLPDSEYNATERNIYARAELGHNIRERQYWTSLARLPHAYTSINKVTKIITLKLK